MEKIALFRLGGILFATDFREVIELIEPVSFREVSHARSPFIGVATRNSEIFPVADLSAILTGKEQNSELKMWLVLKCGNTAKFALQIEGAAQWRSLSREEFVPAESCSAEMQILNPYAKDALLGLYCQQGQNPVPVIDFPALLPRRERNWLEGLCQTGKDQTPAEVAEKLGEEWQRLQKFYPDQVRELLIIALERPSELEESMLQCRGQIAAHIPRSLEEAAPFLVRALWAQGFTEQNEATGELIQDFYSSVVMTTGKIVDWKIEELQDAVMKIMKR